MSVRVSVFECVCLSVSVCVVSAIWFWMVMYKRYQRKLKW